MSKLVRDKIPQIIESTGQVPVTRRCATDDEYLILLADKLQEEVGELLDSADVTELADVAEVLFAFADFAGVDLLQLRNAKLAERGGFSQRVVWEGNRG